MHHKSLNTLAASMVVALGAGTLASAPTAAASELAYLLNVTVRPGYNFANAEHALSYGYGICDKIGHGIPFTRLMGDIKTDFRTSDEYQSTYLISQAAQELCPPHIWQLRNSAGGYVPPSPG